jgi:hypothetical protein
MTVLRFVRPVLRATLSASLLCLTCLALAAPAGAAAPAVLENTAGSRDTLALVNLGNRTSAISTYVTADGALTSEKSWTSARGKFNYSRARFAAGDVNGDGLTDGIVLYNLGHGQARFYVFISDGTKMKKRTAWTSPKGTFIWSRAKLAVGDINADGKDDVLVLYDRGRGRAELQRFISSGLRFKKSLGWHCGAGGLFSSRAQLAAGDANGDGGADAIVLYGGATTRLLTFEAKGTGFVKKTYWSGAYPAGAKLAAGDVDSDGDCDAVCLRDNGDGRLALDAFLSDKTAFAAPAPWWFSDPGAASAGAARFACGDVNADGKADGVLLTPTTTGSFAAVCGSTGSAFEPGAWMSTSTTVAATRLACAPALPFILGARTVILDDDSLAALQTVSPDGAQYTFASGVAQVDGLVADDVMVLAPGPLLPDGAMRMVSSVTTGSGTTVVTTTQAAIADAVTEGELAVGDSFTQDDIAETIRSAPGVRLVPRNDPAALAHGSRRRADPRFGMTIAYNVTLGAANLKGSIGFDQSFSLTSDWGVTKRVLGIPVWWGLKSIRFASTTTQTTEVGASLEGSLSKQVKKDLAVYTFKTKVVWFGPVPVAITPQLTLYVGADGKVTAGISTSVTNVTTVTAGLQWKKGSGWSPIGDFSNTPTFTPPHLFGEMNLRAFIGVELLLKVDFVAGPTAGLEGWIELSANTDWARWWKLVGGLDLTLGFQVKVFGKEMAGFSKNFTLYEHIITQADGKRPPQGAVSGHTLVSGGTAAVDGAAVELRRGAASPSGEVVKTTTSAEDGAYAFTGVTPGNYTVVASKAPYYLPPQSITVAIVNNQVTAGQDVGLSLSAIPGVGGTVAESGDPMEGALVELRQGWDSPLGPLVAGTTTGSNGAYLFTDLLPGAYTVVASRTGYFTKHISVDIGGTIMPGQDIAMIALSEQSVSGAVLDGPYGAFVDGATVTLHEGSRDPAGPVWATTTSAGGAYAFTGVPAGTYTAVATKDGFVRGIREVVVNEGQQTGYADLLPRHTDSVSPAQAPSNVEHIAWPGVGLANADATYELWFKPEASAGGRIAVITWWYDYPTPRFERASTMYLDYTIENKIAFGIKESHGATAGAGTWHEIVSSTQWFDQWHHIAAQNGSAGMRLYIDGHLEASDPYTGGPQTDWTGCLPTDGWFSIGDIDPFGGVNTESGYFKGLRVSKIQRHYMDFTPPAADAMSWDGSTDVLDPLLGDTNGWNYGFVFQP